MAASPRRSSSFRHKSSANCSLSSRSDVPTTRRHAIRPTPTQSGTHRHGNTSSPTHPPTVDGNRSTTAPRAYGPPGGDPPRVTADDDAAPGVVDGPIAPTGVPTRDDGVHRPHPGDILHPNRYATRRPASATAA